MILFLDFSLDLIRNIGDKANTALKVEQYIFSSGIPS